MQMNIGGFIGAAILASIPLVMMIKSGYIENSPLPRYIILGVIIGAVIGNIVWSAFIKKDPDQV